MRWLALLLLLAPAAQAVPVIPNFKQGTLTSHQETTSKVTEVIVSETYSTGFEYTASGVNVQPEGPVNPASTSTINGWTDLGSRPNWSIVNPGEAFQFVESLKSPGLSNVTTIQRTTEINSVVDTVSSFSE